MLLKHGHRHTIAFLLFNRKVNKRKTHSALLARSCNVLKAKAVRPLMNKAILTIAFILVVTGQLYAFLCQPFTLCYEQTAIGSTGSDYALNQLGIPDSNAFLISLRNLDLWYKSNYRIAVGIICIGLFLFFLHNRLSNIQRVKNAQVRIRETIDNLPVGIQCCKFDSLFTILYSNDSFLKMTGYTCEEMEEYFNNKFLLLIHEDDRDTVVKESYNQLTTQGKMSIQHRLIRKDGTLIWVYNSSVRASHVDGSDHVYCVLVDITQEKKAWAKAVNIEQSYQTALRATYEMIFESNVQKDTFVVSDDNWYKIFRRKPISYSDAVAQHYTLCHPEDAQAFWQFTRIDYIKGQAAEGKKTVSIEFRVLQPEGEYSWLSFSIVPIFDTNNQLEKLIGCIQRIDERKNKERKLILSAQMDSLTGFYNKRTTQKLIGEYLSGEGKDSMHAMLLIDIDNFKLVNDTLGHMFGDEVISGISAQIKKVFRNTDIIGRVGGDEFMILIKNLYDDRLADRKAASVCEIFRNTYSGADKSYKISGSIGVAFYPKDGITYGDLYQKTDRALYLAKKKGKDTVAYFSDQTDIISSFCENTVQNENDTVKIEPRNSSDQVSNFAWHVFESLYDATNTPAAIHSILEMLGKRFNVSRVYIFENTSGGRYFSQTYEWCNNDVPSMQKGPFCISTADMQEYLGSFDENGIFYCTDTAKLPPHFGACLVEQNIKSLLEYALMEKGALQGSVGFNQTAVTRVWTKDEIEILSAVSKIIFIFLKKQKIAKAGPL